MIMKAWMAAAVTGLFAAGAATAQIPLDPNNKFSVEWNARLGTDFAYLARYKEANAALVPTPGQPRIVFMGDSITEGWVSKAGAFFKPGRIGRGISGQRGDDPSHDGTRHQTAHSHVCLVGSHRPIYGGNVLVTVPVFEERLEGLS